MDDPLAAAALQHLFQVRRLDFKPLALLAQLDELSGKYQRAGLMIWTRSGEVIMVWNDEANRLNKLLRAKTDGFVVGIFGFSPGIVGFQLTPGSDVEVRTILGESMARRCVDERRQEALAASDAFLTYAQQLYTNEDPNCLNNFLERKEQLFTDYPELRAVHDAECAGLNL